VTETAKSKLKIDVNVHEIQGELQRIIHAFADPVVLSREALEEWIDNRYVGHPSRNFTVPVNAVRAYFARFMGGDPDTAASFECVNEERKHDHDRDERRGAHP
jgi:hypothetical protein